jgi:D-sedoheptulose 7-phosphate isomerase
MPALARPWTTQPPLATHALLRPTPCARGYHPGHMLDLRIQQHFIDSADLHYQVAETLAKPVDAAVQAMLACVTGGGKVMAAGMGPSAALAPYLVNLLVGGFERERPGLAALTLSSDALMTQRWADGQALGRQVLALGQTGDVLVLISADGAEPALVEAVQAAHDRDMVVLALTGHQGGALAKQLRETDVHVCVPHERAARVREVQHLVLHCLCDGVDTQLLGEQEPL